MRFFQLATAFGIGFAIVAPAQEPSASLKQADADYRAGQAALARHDLEEARQDFEKVTRLAPQAEQGHSALGAVLVSLGQTAGGIRELDKALVIDPKDSSAQLNLAMAYEQSGQPVKALPLFLKADAAATASKRALPLYTLAPFARALAASQPAAAIAKMREAVAGDSSNAELHDELGSLYAQRGDWPSAEAEFHAAAQLNPGLASAHLHLGLALQRQLKSGELEELAKAHQLAPSDLKVGLEFGNALAATSHDEEAVPVFQSMVEAHPDAIGPVYGLALVLQRSGKAEAAIPLFEKTVAAEPANAEAFANLGMALTQAQRDQDAVAPLQQAIKLNPKLVTARQNLAAAYIQLNQLDDAVVQLRAALVLDPESPALHYNLGLAFKMQDDASQAVPELTRAEALNPSASEPPYVLGLLAMQAGRYEDAARDLDRSLKLQPQNGDGWATLGSVYAKLDKLPQAAAALQEAIRQTPRQPDSHLTLATVLAKQGQSADAAAERKKAADLMHANMNRQRAEVATNSANSLLRNGKVEESITQLKEALSYDVDYAEAHRGMAAALERQGDIAAAQEERRKAEVLDREAGKQ